MSSRVQKGSTIFKPTVKSRARTTVFRQASVAVEQIPADSSSIQNFTPQSIIQPTILTSDSTTVPSIAPNYVGNVSEPQISPQYATAVPTVIATPTRAPPPVLLQTNVPQSYPRELQAAMPINLPTRADHCYTTLQVASPNHLTAGNADAFCFPTSAAVMPSTEVAAPHMSLNQSSITQDQQEGSSTGLRRNAAVGDGFKKPKKRKASKTSDLDTEDERPTSREAGSRGSSKTPRPGRRAPSMPSFDPNDHPGEDIDPTAMTMASLCVDTGQGRVSSKAAEIMNNHAAWKLSNREKRARMKSIMETKKYGRLEDDVEENPETSTQGEPSTVPSTTTLVTADDAGHGFDYTQGLSTSRFNVQVRIGPNGETIIDENSLVVDRTENNGTENFTHITESDYTKFVNSATYGKRFRGSRWSAEETDLFYDALSQYGENYELIAYILPGRDRKACKNKFKAEDKKNPARINYCLNNRIPIDVATLSRMTGKDFSGPVPEIIAPIPLRPDIPSKETEQNCTPNEESSTPAKKRSRSKSQALSDAGVVVIGDAESFQSS